MAPVARVAVSAATYAADRPYDYSVPERMQAALCPGMRVMVPFGRGNRAAEGIVLSLAEDSNHEKLKSLLYVLDEVPVLTNEQLSLALRLRQRLFCTVYELVRAMLPAALWYRMEHTWKLCAGVDREQAAAAAGRSETAQRLVAALFTGGGEAPESVLREVAAVPIQSQLKRLADAGIIEPSVRESRRAGDKTLLLATLDVDGQEAVTLAGQRRRKAPLQAAVLQLLSQTGAAFSGELCTFTGASMQTLRRLEKEGLLRLSRQEVYRRPHFRQPEPEALPVLNTGQAAAFQGLSALLQAEKAAAALLYGVTGSGKTAVYIHLIQKTLDLGKTAIFLVPEISLTPQLLQAFIAHFGDTVAVYHSSLSMGERYDEWKRVRAGHARVVIGTRSAVFAPVQDLGLIILDEEQEHTYKSENSPRYHARDVAKFRCADAKALLLLGSATPAVETMYAAETGRYVMFRLENRYNAMELPQVLITDMKKELRAGNGGSISRQLQEELEKNIVAGEQSILFINRRGTAPLVTCPDCGYVFNCPRCSVSLTYHAARQRLLCHYCGHSQRLPEACPDCGGLLKQVGTGTQRVEEELHTLFPDVEVLRMDMDSVSAKHSHEALLSKFEKKRIPILVGTQMVAKGLNFPNVTLVGVISADQSLYVGDYRSGERTFSLLTQVIGRSGRGSKSGRALIQTFTPDNPVLCLAAAQDYDGFYEREIQLRRLLDAPPLTELFVITVSGSEEEQVCLGCSRIRAALAQALAGSSDIRILGPAPAAITKVNNCFRYRVTLAAPDTKTIRQLVDRVVRGFAGDRRSKGLHVWADIDPEN